MVGIPFATPDNTPLDDMNVWNSIKEDTTMIFQWESDSATHYLKQLLSDETVKKIKEKYPNFSYMDLLSIGNGAIRPAGDSYRNQLAKGEFATYGNEALDEFMKPTLGWMVYQETIMNFLNKFCGFTMGEADIVRRGFAKKTGTDIFIPKIKEGFEETMLSVYNVKKEESDKTITTFVKVIDDASDYLFSYNHALPYSFIGYICGYLRYYYPVQFITVALNIFNGDEEKTNSIIEYCKKNGISIYPARFRKSRAEYVCDVENKVIYKGISSIKKLNEKVAEEMYELRNKKYNDFVELLYDLLINEVDGKRVTTLKADQLKALIELDFFEEFGDANYLLKVYKVFDKYGSSSQIKKENALENGISFELLNQLGEETDKTFRKINSKLLVRELCKKIKFNKRTIKEIIKSQKEHLGYVEIKDDKYARMLYVLSINTKYTPRLEVYSLKNGTILNVKVDKKTFNKNKIHVDDVIYVKNQTLKNKMKKSDSGWEILDEKEMWLLNYVFPSI